jgi:hypothetical protein
LSHMVVFPFGTETYLSTQLPRPVRPTNDMGTGCAPFKAFSRDAFSHRRQIC